jgi:hypothetical protein
MLHQCKAVLELAIEPVAIAKTLKVKANQIL